MVRMIRAEWYKMIKSTGFKILCAVALVLGIMSAVLNTVMTEDVVTSMLQGEYTEEQIEELMASSNNNDSIVTPGQLGFHTTGVEDMNNVKSIEEFKMSFGTGVIEILLAVLVGIMVAKEYSEGTIKNTLAYGKKRSSFYIAKFINIIFGLAIMMGLMTIISVILFTIINGWNQEFNISQIISMVQVFLGAVITYGAVAAVLMFISTVVKSNGATIGISVGIFILVPTVLAFFYGKNDVFDKIYELSLFYNTSLVTAMKATASDILRASIVGIITMAIAVSGGILLLNKQDIK